MQPVSPATWEATCLCKRTAIAPVFPFFFFFCFSVTKRSALGSTKCICAESRGGDNRRATGLLQPAEGHRGKSGNLQ